MKDVGFSINDTLYDAYKNSSTSRVASNNLTISGGPNSTGDFNAAPVLGEEPKSFYTAQLQQSWENDYNDVAIVMLAREGGEDCEMMMEDPDGISALALHQDEKDMLAMIRDSGKFSKIVVLLNSAYPMELGWMDEYNVDACLWIGDPGQRGFEGVANLLTGKENPSGHLTDTYAANSLSSPAAYTQSQNVAEWSNVDEVLNSGIVTDSPLHVSYTATQAEVLRKEWGFNGQQETDGVAGGAYKSHFATSLSAGTTTYCIDPTGSAASAIVEEIRSNDDGNMLLNLRDAVKRYHYMLSHTNLINGLSMNATVESIMPWWQIALYAIDVVFALLMVGSLFMMFRAKRRSEEKA